ncbi:secreted protein [Streptomyces davaonensis JCM 4913]|uniref:Secreted protein n=2 Tax=Streptomyces davaonensis TaxID=348043 RepID=K4R310_STRDJ|nr:secreted protein [Streptomyces davaonensis JCM 4913]
MSGRLPRLVCTAAMAAGTVLAPLPAAAVPEPGEPSVSRLLTDLQRLYREAERATETYNATEERLKEQRAEVRRLDGELSRVRLSLHDSRGAAGRLARQQYQGSTEISSYVRLLLARSPQHALEQGHVIGQLARERAETVGRLTGSEKKADELARKARTALDKQLALAERQKKDRDEVRGRLSDVEEMLSSLTAEQLGEIAELEEKGVQDAQRDLVTSGALGAGPAEASSAGEKAVRYAMRQLGKPYEWGAEGPRTYDCSGLTSEAWDHAGTSIPRTSQEQWARLPRVELDGLRPGDLVVYHRDATHVAMYLGAGEVVEAPRTGERIKVSPIAAHPILGAVRPDGDQASEAR